MAVKAIRIFLAAVVLVMSVANILFIVENWNTALTEATGRSWPLEKEEIKTTVPSTAIETSPGQAEGGIVSFTSWLMRTWTSYLYIYYQELAWSGEG